MGSLTVRDGARWCVAGEKGAMESEEIGENLSDHIGSLAIRSRLIGREASASHRQIESDK